MVHEWLNQQPRVQLSGISLHPLHHIHLHADVSSALAAFQKSPTGGSHTLLDTCHGDAIEVHWAPGSPANLPTWRWRHTSRPSGCESLGSSQGGSLGESHPQLPSKQLCTLTLTYPLRRRRRRFWAGESAPWVKSLLHQLEDQGWSLQNL